MSNLEDGIAVFICPDANIGEEATHWTLVVKAGQEYAILDTCNRDGHRLDPGATNLIRVLEFLYHKKGEEVTLEKVIYNVKPAR